MLKHGLIADSNYWNDCTQVNFDSLNWIEIIKKSISIKEQIVQSDPFEKGDRKKLNFGHTIGHAIESYFLSKNTPVLHGYTVGAGMLCESYIALQKGVLSKEAFDLIELNILKIYKKLTFNSDVHNEMIEFMKQDKKNNDSSINMTLLIDIGNALINQSANEIEIRAALNFYCSN